MSRSLTEALQRVDLDLRVGQTYRCEVRGKIVEVRVLEDQLPGSFPAIHESDVLLDPWVELPAPQADTRIRVCVLPEARLPVDIPEIPADEDT